VVAPTIMDIGRVVLNFVSYFLLCLAFLNPLCTAVSEPPVRMIKRGEGNVKYKIFPPAAIILSLKIFNAKIEFKESELSGR
jgi:hypothetical protein